MIRRCVECGLEVEALTAKTKYCSMCKVTVQKRQSKKWVKENRCVWNRYHRELKSARSARQRLKIFYENLRINLIKSPYFMEKNVLPCLRL